jgi:hypothetical protein
LPDRNRPTRNAAAGPFNWLQSLDEAAPTLKRAGSWLQPYGPFMLIRYPHLRPKPSRDDRRRKRMLESAEACAFRLVAEWESRIAHHKEAADCLHGLNPGQWAQLSALLIETVDAFEDCKQQGAGSRLRRHLAGEAKRRTSVLHRRLEKARKAVQELKDYASDSGTRHSLDESSHAARQMLGQKYRLAAQRALRELDVQNAPADLESERNEYPTPGRAEGFGMVQLYWFFRHECRLRGDESEVRVARLRNAFWTEHGIGTVKYRPTYKDAESMGCDAVHVAVLRYRPAN